MREKKIPRTITEKGVVFQQSSPFLQQLLCRILGVILAAIGALFVLMAPIPGAILFAIGVAFAVWFPKCIKPTKKFVSFADHPCAGHHTFGSWNARVHNGQAQVDRFEKAMHQPMEILAYNADTGLAEIQGSGSDSYLTSLNECTCPDFDKRSRPCKHIYFLAIQMGYTSDAFYNS